MVCALTWEWMRLNNKVFSVGCRSYIVCRSYCYLCSRATVFRLDSFLLSLLAYVLMAQSDQASPGPHAISKSQNANRFLGIQLVWEHDVKSSLNIPSTSMKVDQVKSVSDCKKTHPIYTLLISSLLIENIMHNRYAMVLKNDMSELVVIGNMTNN